MADLALRGQGLNDYVSVVCAMEQNLYRQKAAVKDVEERIRVLSNPYVKPDPAAPKMANKKFGSITCMVIGGFFAITALQGVGSTGYFLAVIVLGFLALWFLGKGLDIIETNKRIEADKKQKEAFYKKELAEHKQSVNHAAAQRQMAQILRARLEEMQARVNDMERDLSRAYSCNVIYPAYRNLVAVTSFHDYLQSGRCERLDGHEGAYNLFNLESRLDKIITKLDQIGSQLESIKYNQQMLYTTMKESKQQLEILNGAARTMTERLDTLAANEAVTNAQLEKLNYNTELIKFNTDQTRQEIALRNRMDGILNFNYR